MATAHPRLVGSDLGTLKDKIGKCIRPGDDRGAGEVSEVAYMWPRLDSIEPVQKASYVTKVADQI